MTGERAADQAADHAVQAVAAGLRRRMLDLRRAETQLARFAFSEDDAPAPAPPAAPAWDRVALRALGTGTDPENFLILRRLVDDGDVTLARIGEWLGADRLTAVERVSLLTQCGCVARNLETDRVGATELGQGLVALVEAIANHAANGDTA